MELGFINEAIMMLIVYWFPKDAIILIIINSFLTAYEIFYFYIFPKASSIHSQT